MKDKTAIVMILDVSGSMGSLQQSTISNFNEFLQTQKNLPGEASMTVVLFNDKYNVLYMDQDINLVDPLNESTYCPDGMTALHYAMIKTIDDVGKRLAGLSEEERPNKVLVVTITDGMENWSGRYGEQYTRQGVFDRVLHQRKTYNWEFQFLGANIDSFEVGTSFGIKTENIANYSANPTKLKDTYNMISASMTLYRTTGSTSKLQDQI